MRIAPESIIVRKRIRQELGDISGLMESLKTYGQLTPIIINEKHELIAGFRRLQAVKRLGWKSIEAVVIDRPTEQQKLEVELEENIQRLALAPEEIADGMARLQRLRRPGLWARIRAFILRILRSIFPRKRKRR